MKGVGNLGFGSGRSSSRKSGVVRERERGKGREMDGEREGE